MLLTEKWHTDETVILEPGDHPFITRKSSVHFSTAKLYRVAMIQNAIKRGRCSLKSDMTPELLVRVRQGLLDSTFTVNVIREYCWVRF